MSLTASIQSPQFSKKSVHLASKTGPGKKEFADAAAAVVATLAAYEAQPDRDETRLEFRRALRVAAEAIAQFPRQHPRESYVTEALALIRTVADSGVWDHPLASTEIAAMGGWSLQGWPGVLAAMLSGPAWQWPAAPALDAVPDWLWGDYAEWL